VIRPDDHFGSGDETGRTMDGMLVCSSSRGVDAGRWTLGAGHWTQRHPAEGLRRQRKKSASDPVSSAPASGLRVIDAKMQIICSGLFAMGTFRSESSLLSVQQAHPPLGSSRGQTGVRGRHHSAPSPANTPRVMPVSGKRLLIFGLPVSQTLQALQASQDARRERKILQRQGSASDTLCALSGSHYSNSETAPVSLERERFPHLQLANLCLIGRS
jgi:hypothetical protein